MPYGETGAGGVSSGVGYRSASPYTDDDEAKTTRTPSRAAASNTRCEASTLSLDVEREDVAEAAHARLAGEVEDAVEAREVELVHGQVEPPHVEPLGVLLLERAGRSSR